MKTTFKFALAAGALAGGTAQADEILVSSDINTSTTWTSDNTYNLQDQIFVLPGATLTIEAGTVIASTTDLGGSLAVTRGAQIFVEGTATKPVIFTSKADVATWDADPSHPTGGNPFTGTWREAANEWGNLTIMGRAYISEDATPGNTPAPSSSNVAPMEGLEPDASNPTKTLYGGGNDNYDAGSISYVSFRYGGRVIEQQNELNAISLGGIGRGTDIHHVDIMNNVDDGIEIWGGTLDMTYVNVWNIGDDSVDVDQGWRGRMQHGVVVQGYSQSAKQGSGVGDNCIEMDGAEDSDYQPVTTAVLANFTVVGMPGAKGGDGGTAWRDNARVQFYNNIFMDIGDQVVRFDNDDTDGAKGYGFNGTLSWEDTWTTAFSVTSPVNPFAAANPLAQHYQAQTQGNLIEFKNNVFFRNQLPTAYDEAIARGVFDPANNNDRILNGGVEEFDIAEAPIINLVRGPQVLPKPDGDLDVFPIASIDLRPKNEGIAAGGSPPNDGFFDQTTYRGAIDPNGPMWLCGWTAAWAFGFLESTQAAATSTSGVANVNSNGAYTVSAGGSPVLGNSSFTVDFTGAPIGGLGVAFLFVADAPAAAPFPLLSSDLWNLDLTGTLNFLAFGISANAALNAVIDGTGAGSHPFPIPYNCKLLDLPLSFQSVAIDFGQAATPIVNSNALNVTFGDQ